MNIILMGPPGSGKGTHAKFLAACYGLTHVCMGDLVRAGNQAGGKSFEDIAAQGNFLPDDAATEILRCRLAEPDAERVILDGYPRTIEQQQTLHDALGMIQAIVVDLHVPDQEVLIARIEQRSAAEGRADDALETFQRRLRTFNEKTQPVIDDYRRWLPGLLMGGLGLYFHQVRADRPISEVQADLRKALDPVFARSGDLFT